MLTTRVLSDRNQRFCSWVKIFGSYVCTYEFYIIIESDNSTILSRFYIFLAYVTRLIIEKTMRITTPSYTSHVYSKYQNICC